jgi:hypothetical protein
MTFISSRWVAKLSCIFEFLHPLRRADGTIYVKIRRARFNVCLAVRVSKFGQFFGGLGMALVKSPMCCKARN